MKNLNSEQDLLGQIDMVRRLMEISIEDLCQKAGISRSKYQRAKANEAMDLKLEDYLALCKPLGLEITMGFNKQFLAKLSRKRKEVIKEQNEKTELEISRETL